MADNSQLEILLSSDDNMSPSNEIQQECRHSLIQIPAKIRRKLCLIAIYNILFGILISGLAVELMIDERIIM
jgi:hypothetical protein